MTNTQRKKYIRGYLTPNYIEEKNELEHIKDISEETNLVDIYLDYIKTFFKNFFKDEIDNIQDLKKFNDLYTIFTYGALSYYWKNFVEKWLKEKYDYEGKRLEDFMKVEFKKLRDITYDFYNTFPADERPGLNTSSLLIHLLATSALSSCIAEEKHHLKKESSDENFFENLQYIRTSSFFHEIGKPLARNNVYGSSISLLDKHLNELFSSEILNKIKEIIKGLESESSSALSQYIKTGSKLSLASRRLKDIVFAILKKNSPDIENYFDDMEFWEKNEDKIEDLTLEVLTSYKDVLKHQKPIELKYKENGLIALVRGDVRHIHEYTDHVLKLEELRNASKLLDYILSVDLVYKLIEKRGVNPENIIYSSGGNIILFSPKSKVNPISESTSESDNGSLTDFIEQTFKTGMKDGLEMTTDYIYFYNEDEDDFQDSFGTLYSRLAIKIGAKKNDLRSKEIPILLGSAKICDSCGAQMAIEPKKYGEETKFLCASCLYKLELKDRHDLTLEYRWPIYRDIKDYLMEFISGVRFDDITRKKNDNEGVEFKPHKLAIINADGNLMSEFIAQSISLSDLYSRIMRISNAIHQIFDIIENKENGFLSQELDEVRFDMGKVYFGGDDILLLVPSYLAIPISLTFTKEFHKRMGRECTLSTGIFLCPNKFPIWTAISTARELLGSAKKLGRRCDENINDLGVIDFQSFSSGLSVPDYISKPISKDGKKVFTRRPFYVSVNDNQDKNKNPHINEIHSLLNNMIDKKHQISTSLKENYTNLYNFIQKEMDLLYKNDDESVLKDFRNKAKRVLSFFSYEPDEIFYEEKQLALSFVMYQTVRQKRDLSRNSYLKIFNLIGKTFKKDEVEDFLFFDSIEILKFLTGGLK